MSKMIQGGGIEAEKLQDVRDAVAVIKSAILKAQSLASRDVNRYQLSLYFGIGRYVSENTRHGKWGTGAISTISKQLQKELPGLHGFGERNIKNMRQFFEQWSPFLNRQPPAAETEQLDADALLSAFRQPAAAEISPEEFLSVSFSHHIEILSKTSSLDERIFYIKAAIAGRWSKLDLRRHLSTDDYNHIGRMPNNFPAAITDAKLSRKTVAMFKDEYLLDFINVEDIDAADPEDVDERQIENAIIANIRKFIMTFGHDFSFVGNQYRLEIEGHEQFVDLLFFNRELNSLVAVELKRGEFKPAYLGQLHLYLQALEDQVKKPHENPPIGIILCRSADRTFVEYAVRDYNKPMGVATYRTADEMPERLRKALPPMEEMAARLEDCAKDEEAGK